MSAIDDARQLVQDRIAELDDERKKLERALERAWRYRQETRPLP
jgi:hypothetical protein